MSFDNVCFAVGIAGMVDESRGVPGDIAVNVVSFVEFEEIDGAFCFAGFGELFIGALVRLCFGEFLANVFDDARIFWDVFFCEYTFVVYA